MTHKEILYKIIGPIRPYGASEVDEERYKNLQALCILVDDLIDDIQNVAAYKSRPEKSMKEMGQYASDFIKELNQRVEP